MKMKVWIVILIASFVHASFAAKCPTCKDCANNEEMLMDCQLNGKYLSLLKLSWMNPFSSDGSFVCISVTYPDESGSDYQIKECAVGDQNSVCAHYYEEHGEDRVACDVTKPTEDEPSAPSSEDPISSDEPTSSDDPISSDEPSSPPSEDPISSDEPTSSDDPISSDEPTSSDDPISSDEPPSPSSENPISSDEPTPSSSDDPTSSDEPSSPSSEDPISSDEPTSSDDPISSDEPSSPVTDAPTGEPSTEDPSTDKGPDGNSSAMVQKATIFTFCLILLCSYL